MTHPDLAALSPRQYAALLIRHALGILYLGHALLMWTIFGMEHVVHYFASLMLPPWIAYALAGAELLGATLLLLGLQVRTVALALVPIAGGTALIHLATGVGWSLAYGAYLAGSLAGQALLASGVLAARPEDGLDAPIMEGLRLRA